MEASIADFLFAKNNKMKFILGEKQNMTQVFKADGSVVPATLLVAGPIVVTQIKNEERDGYKAIQVGYGVRKEKNISKSVRGHVKGLGNFKAIREFPLVDAAPEVGAKIDVSSFAEGDIVEVSAISKAKGFQGVVKRHGFHGGPRTHGQKHSEREPGSIGGGGRDGGRVAKGKRMAGRMGGERVTVRNLKIVAVDLENNHLLISGAVPGRRGTLVEVRSYK